MTITSLRYFKSINTENWRLLMAMLGSYFFTILYNLVVFANSPVFVYTYSALMVMWIMLSYILIGDLLIKIFYLVALSICLPMISHPLSYLPSGFFDAIKDSVMITDRIQIRSLLVSLVGFILFLDVVLFTWKKGSVVGLKIVFFAMILILVTFSHSYQNLSVMQVIIDLGLLFGCVATFGYFRAQKFDEMTLRRAYSMFGSVLLALCILVTLDVLVSLTGLVSWSTSYRDGIQGVFYAMEAPFAFVVGLALTFGLTKLQYLRFGFVALLLIGGTILTMTNIKSAVAAVFVATVLLPVFKFRFFQRLKIPLIVCGAALISVVAFNLEVGGSLLSRVGTYAAYYFTIIEDFHWLYGIAPGVTGFSMKTNLAQHFFTLDFAPLLIGFDEAIVGEVVERSGYRFDEVGAFLPHNVGAALISSYGIILVAPAVYYLFVSPYRIISYLDRESHIRFCISTLLIYIIFFMFLHPFMFLAPLVMFTELLFWGLRGTRN